MESNKHNQNHTVVQFLPTHKRAGKGEKICTLGVRMLRFIVPVKFRQLV